MNHSGDITSNETWYLAGSPHIITDHLYIKSGAQLTIEASCQVKIDEAKKIEIQSGSIIAVGTLGNGIIFTKNTANDWYGLVSIATNTYGTQNDFKYCIFEYATGGTDCIGFDTYAPAYFDNNIVRYCKGYFNYFALTFRNLNTDFVCNNLTLIGDGTHDGALNIKDCQTVTFNDLEAYNLKFLTFPQAPNNSGSVKVILNRPIVHDLTWSGFGEQRAFALSQPYEINYGLFYDINIEEYFIIGINETVNITNCTFYNVIAGQGAITSKYTTTNITVRNCIFDSSFRVFTQAGTGVLTSRYNWFYNNTGWNYGGTISDKTGDDISETNPELINPANDDYGILPSSPCATSGEGSPYEDYRGYSAPTLPYPSFEGSDTLTLADTIELNLSLEKAEISESLTLSDEIHIAFSKQQELSDIMALSDDIDVSLSKSLSDTLSLGDAIIIDTVEPSVNDFNNIFGMVSGAIKDINNKFGMLAESKSDINNKVGFLKSWQVSGDAGYQSLGKTYVKVYINSIEQTDIDIDSITISKVLNSPHTASFILGRPYDNSKPSQESEVEIKYHIWTLYKGYITQINPTDSPDTIRIDCQDKYWKQNKTKKYFSVGHKPTDNQELYYNTISEGLSACGASFDIGNFIPQTMNLFGNGKSDCISNLVTNSGNFGWYYDIDETKKLCTAGQGDIVYLEKQELGTNLGLHQVLRQSFKESIDRIVNKFRVQMGDFVWRRFDDIGGVKEYAGTRLSQYLGQIFPKWNNSYERLATGNYEPAYLDEDNNVVAQVGTSGVFRHSIEENDLYKDVFVKYDLPGLNPDFESWNDKVSPHIIVRFPFFAGWKLSGSLKAPTIIWFPLGFRYELSEGFTIDYEKGEVIFNEPVYLYQSNATGDITQIKRAKLEIAIYKERYYSDTENPSDDPETDISNPLMFFTEKYGDYPETIIKNLNLSGLGIQIGGWEIVGRDDNNKPIYRYTPSWKDTAFAVDLANWRLTQNCDKKVSGSAEVTIDTICFYDINLSNRIIIEGVIENPLNIISISYNVGSWRVSLGLENGRYFKRSISIPSHGE